MGYTGEEHQGQRPTHDEGEQVGPVMQIGYGVDVDEGPRPQHFAAGDLERVLCPELAARLVHLAQLRKAGVAIEGP